jgi:glycosyltransferase involved in cell wall biosynthesis
VVVVTSNSDRETAELCRKLSVRCFQTGKFFRNGDPFNKAKGINHGLKYLTFNDWVAHLDADTMLSPRAGWWMRHRALDEGSIYGCDRVECKGWDAWQRWKGEDSLGYDYDCRVSMPSYMKLLDRHALVDDGGYVPIGFFQLWNIGASSRRYPVAEGTFATAERSDVTHATQWDENQRILMPEFFAIHLAPDGEIPLGTNWRGRNYDACPRFGPPNKGI